MKNAKWTAKEVKFEGWNCLEIKNGDFRLLVTLDVGPRIIGAFLGKNKKNLFYVDPKLKGKAGPDGKWVNYGGHRLWHSPETLERTYVPDNSPVTCTKMDDGISITADEGENTGIIKTLQIYPQEDSTFEIRHIMENNGVWPVQLAPWAITVMAPGGTAIVPQNPEREGLQPTKFVSIWPYTDMQDKRITWGRDYVLVKQESAAKTKPLKIGMNSKAGVVIYVNDGIAFVKTADYCEDMIYPDNGCNVEIYTCREMLEAETLAPLIELNPGEAVRYSELWFAEEVEGDIKNEADVDRLLDAE